MRVRIAALAAALAAVAACAGPAYAAQGDRAVGRFDDRLAGTSTFVEGPDPRTVQVTVDWRRLPANRAWWTVIYGGTRCDPASASPVGPFLSDSRGRVKETRTFVVLPGLTVAATESVSVRRGDNATDIDGDGLVGPGDVVAVPGQPRTGLRSCDRNPDVAAD